MLYIEFGGDYVKMFFRKGRNHFYHKSHISDLEDAKNFISDFILENNIKVKKVSIIIKSTRIFKKIEIYKDLSEKEIKSMFLYNMSEIFSIDISDYIFDYEIIFKENKKNYVMFVAAAKTLIKGYLSLIDELKLTCISIDLYQNAVACPILKHFRTKTLIAFEIDSKYGFIYLENGKISAMREIVLDFKKDVLPLINQGLGFFDEEIYSIKDFLILDDIPQLEHTFERFPNAFIYNRDKLLQVFSIDTDCLAFCF